MKNVPPTILVNQPRTFEPAVIEDFVALVLAGGEVIAHGLIDRVRQAELIAYLREGKCLLGVAGLKKPSTNHRAEVSAGAGVTVSVRNFPLELGWVFILPSERGRKLSLTLCKSLIATSSSKGIFATSRTTNIAMHKTLAKLGFTHVGKEWPSQRGSGSLELFIRSAA